jgi:MSHA biogenesis protein MshQ
MTAVKWWHWLLLGLLLLSQPALARSACPDLFAQPSGVNPDLLDTGGISPSDLEDVPWQSNTWPASGAVLAAGDYYFGSLVTGDGYNLAIAPGARVTIYVNDALVAMDNLALNRDGTASQLTLVVRSSVSIQNNAQINGLLFAAGAVSIGNNLNLNGGLAANGAISLGTATVNRNLEAINNLTLPGLCDSSSALTCLADDFSTSALSDNWVTAHSSGSFTPEVVRVNDIHNRLRMTEAQANQATSATYQRLYPAADNLVIIEFDYWAYGGNGADGIAVILSDASVTPQPGAFGGSLGYAQKGPGTDCPNCPGFAGGWLGIALDEYGNFSSPTEGRVEGPGFRSQSVSIRGAAAGNYRYLAGTAAGLSPSIDNVPASGNGHRYKITIDSTAAGQAMVSVERDTGAGFQTLIAPFNALTHTGQAPVPENFFVSITGSTGGSNNIHELDNLSICAMRSLPVGQQIDHIELTHQATGIACVASAVQVKACLNADCSALYTSPVVVDLSNSAGNWQTDPITLNNGVGTAYLRHPAGGVATIGVTETVPPRKAFSQTVCKVGSTNSNCQISFANAGLLFTQADGVTPLSHQTAGVAFNGVLRAIRTNTTTGACEARASGSQTVRLGFSCENPSNCIAGQQFSINNTQVAANGAAANTNRSNVNLTFNASGSAPLTMRYTDVGQLALHASLALPEQSSDPAITLNGSSNAFVVRPHTLAVVQALRQNGSANPATQIGGNGFVAAGEPFNVVMEARNADGQATPNFGKELNRQRVEAVFNQLVYPSSGNNGTLSGGAVDTAAAALNGRQTVTGVSWNEAGSITLRAKMLNDTYLGIADISAKPASAVIGRFYPDNFALASSEVSNSCTNFSYMSQPALTVNYQLEAKGRGGNTLQNYHSAHYPVGAATMLTVVQDNSTRLAAERLAVQAAQWQQGVYRVQQNNASFNRGEAPDGPYNNMQLGLQIVSEQDSRNFPAFTLGADALALSGTLNMRNGRLVLQNSGGPEDEPVPLAFKTEYWQGGRFINNIEDNCSLISNSSALLSTISGTPALSMTGVGGVVQNGRFPAQSLTLAPPGVPGVWQVEYMAEPWLQYHWRGASANYQQNPQAEIMFGRFRGNPRQIFWRELFR